MIPFLKMHGLGNDFVLLDGIAETLAGIDLSALAQWVCDRRFGVGADGLLILERQDDRLRMRMFNPDGSPSEMCGNGLRCLARYAHQQGYAPSAFPVVTGAGELNVHVQPDGWVEVDMGPVAWKRGDIGMEGDPSAEFLDQPIEADGCSWTGTAVATGNPHLVLFVDHVDSVDLFRFGPILECHPLFPNRTNVHFVQVQGPDMLWQRTWERGAGATLACGTGACAAVAAAFATGRCGRRATVRLPGGDLRISYNEAGHAIMAGPAEFVFDGRLPVTLPATSNT